MRTICLFLALAGLASAQLDDQTITVTATSTPATASRADRFFVTMEVTAALGASLDEVLKTVSATGVTEQDLSYVSEPRGGPLCPTPPPGCLSSPSTIRWGFSFTAPIAKATTVLSTLQQLSSRTSPAMPISIWVQGSGPAATPAAPDCAYPTLISQARRQAESLAAASGARVGQVLAMSDAPASAYPVGAILVPTAVLRLVDFSSSMLGDATPTYVPSCAVVVQFKLLR